MRSPFAGNPAHLELLPPREGKITSTGDKEVDGAWSAIVPESGVELCQVNRQIERPNLLDSLFTNRHKNSYAYLSPLLFFNYSLGEKTLFYIDIRLRFYCMKHVKTNIFVNIIKVLQLKKEIILNLIIIQI